MVKDKTKQSIRVPSLSLLPLLPLLRLFRLHQLTLQTCNKRVCLLISRRQEQTSKPGVIKIDSPESWDLYMNQAKAHGSPVVVHFTASWCIPSVAMNPFFEEIASRYPDALFLTVDVDDVKEVASKLEVKAMPTFLLIKDGAQVDKLVGANPEEIRKRVDGFVQSIRVYTA